MRVLLGISGASGAVYGLRAGTMLLRAGADLHVLVTGTAWDVMAGELPPPAPPPGLAARRRWLAARMSSRRPFALYAEGDFRIPFASGSNPPDAMIIAPCSMGTLGRIAHGTSPSVLSRCADVALKEGRRLVLVPRETPLSVIHLENMLALARAGAVVLPACPGFYHRPGSVGALVDFVVGRALARAGVENDLLPRWGEARRAANRIRAVGAGDKEGRKR